LAAVQDAEARAKNSSQLYPIGHLGVHKPLRAHLTDPTNRIILFAYSNCRYVQCGTCPGPRVQPSVI